MSLNSLHTVGSLGIDAGGPTRTVTSLCTNLAQAHIADSVTIVTGLDGRLGNNIDVPGIRVETLASNSSRNEYHLFLMSFIKSNNVTLIHDHGQWLPINRASATTARSVGIPRIVTPRGMLSPWAMRHRRTKKLAAWLLFGKRDISAATVLHATSELECNELRQLGLKNPIAIIPNGVDLHFDAARTATIAPERPYVLFMSRLHPKKGIHELLRAWRKVDCRGWSLKIAGPDESKMLPRLQLPENAEYVGAVDGLEKRSLLANASLFILPSHSENFGVVVAESLAEGVPVIATHGTPWESLQTERCGWWIPLEEHRLMQTIQCAIQSSPEELRSMGDRGRSFVQRQFNWEGIAESMRSVYEWMLGRCSQPPCIR